MTSRITAADLSVRWPAARRLLAGHRRTVDVCLAVLFAGAPIVAATVLASPEWPATLAALALAGVALFWRRGHPLVVAAVVAVLTVAPAPSYLVVPLALAVYTAAVETPPLSALLGYGIAVVIPIVITTGKHLLGLPANTAPIAPNPITLGANVVEPLLVVALIAGLIVRAAAVHRSDLAELLNQQIDNATVLERNRITGEMHDVVGHSLTVMIALANGAAASWEKHPEESAVAMQRVAEVGQSALLDLQRTLRMLREADPSLDETLDDSGVATPKLEHLVQLFRDAGLPVRLVRRGPALPDDVLLCNAVHRIVQEALTNTLRYAAEPTMVEVSIERTGDDIAIRVVDDGDGRARPSRGTGRGLLGIRERASALSGTSGSGRRSGGGWETWAVLPVGSAAGGGHG